MAELIGCLDDDQRDSVGWHVELSVCSDTASIADNRLTITRPPPPSNALGPAPQTRHACASIKRLPNERSPGCGTPCAGRVCGPDRSSFHANRTAVASTCKLRRHWRKPRDRRRMPGCHDQHTARLLTKAAAAGTAPRLSCGQAISGTRRCASANSKSHSSSTSAATSWLPVPLEPVQLVFVPLPRFHAVEGRRRHGTTGRAVEQQAGTAKSVELLECGQDSRLVEIDASVDLIRADLDPGGSHTGTVIDRWSRCKTAISHSSTSALPPKTSAARSRSGPNRLRARAHWPPRTARRW